MEINRNYFVKFNEEQFVVTGLEKLVDRAWMYITAGIPINFSGTSGTGKTTLALYLASILGRPVVLIHGNDELVPSDFIGGDFGYQKKKKIDNYISSVYEIEESLRYHWVDGQLSKACKEGYTVVYDEFTRSRPEANNLLLAILEEGVLSLTGWQEENRYLKVHPDFRIIFTSNPEEYAGVHRSQVALKDRMITLDMEHFDRDTEVAIVSNKTGLGFNETEKIVDKVRDFRLHSPVQGTSVRSSIKMARVALANRLEIDFTDSIFQSLFRDIIFSEIKACDRVQKEKADELLGRILE